MLQQHQSHLGDAPASLHFFCISPTSAQEDPENWNKAALLITRTKRCISASFSPGGYCF